MSQTDERRPGDTGRRSQKAGQVASARQSTARQGRSTTVTLAADGRRENGRWVGWTKTTDSTCEEPRNFTAGERKQRELAGIVLDHAPDLAPAVVSGDLALDAAFRQAETNRDAERHRLEREEREAAEEADPWWRSCADRAIDYLAACGEPFSADHVQALIPPADHPCRIGARFHAAVRAGVIRPVGYVLSTRPSRHRGVVRLYRGGAAR